MYTKKPSDGETGAHVPLSVLFWNVENFFDWRNDSTSVSDAEFSARGERHWTWKRFQAKAHAFAKGVLWTASETGRLPDVIGLAEVENSFVLRQLLQNTALRKLDYKYVHYDSPDRRGIDVALLYRSSIWELTDSKACHLYEDASGGAAADSVLATRDILLCRFRRRSALPDPPSARSPGPRGNASFAVLVNHHPSKYGGAAVSEPRRRLAVQRLRFLADSLSGLGVGRIIACGDFNETPANPVFRLLEPALLPLHMDLYRRGMGTIKYDGKWELIDHFYLSPAWFCDFSHSREETSSSIRAEDIPQDAICREADLPRMRILRIPFLLTRDTAHTGEKPLRTYLGPRYTGGVSDHLPILLDVLLPPP